jgi:hypothetical protein
MATTAIEPIVTAEVTEQGTPMFSKRVGSTLYRCRVYFNSANTEPVEGKILRCAKNDLLFGGSYATMNLLQTGRSPQEGSL